jgi:hypothetical protein
MADDAQRPEDGGVIGNLPHTRPGRRSEKRAAGRPAATAGAAARKAEAGGAKAAATPRPKRAKSSAAAPADPPRESGTGGPLADLVHGAEKVAGAGVRVAGGLAREILRRLPRP